MIMERTLSSDSAMKNQRKLQAGMDRAKLLFDCVGISEKPEVSERETH